MVSYYVISSKYVNHFDQCYVLNPPHFVSYQIKRKGNKNNPKNSFRGCLRAPQTLYLSIFKGLGGPRKHPPK